MFEARGLPTVSLTSARDITERVRPPRAAFLDYPLGNQTGHPHNAGEQREIVLAALQMLETATAAGQILDLPYEWDEPDWREQVRALYERDAATVLRQRTTGEFRGGEHFAAQECADVCSLI